MNIKKRIISCSLAAATILSSVGAMGITASAATITNKYNISSTTHQYYVKTVSGSTTTNSLTLKYDPGTKTNLSVTYRVRLYNNSGTQIDSKTFTFSSRNDRRTVTFYNLTPGTTYRFKVTKDQGNTRYYNTTYKATTKNTTTVSKPSNKRIDSGKLTSSGGSITTYGYVGQSLYANGKYLGTINQDGLFDLYPSDWNLFDNEKEAKYYIYVGNTKTNAQLTVAGHGASNKRIDSGKLTSSGGSITTYGYVGQSLYANGKYLGTINQDGPFDLYPSDWNLFDNEKEAKYYIYVGNTKTNAQLTVTGHKTSGSGDNSVVTQQSGKTDIKAIQNYKYPAIGRYIGYTVIPDEDNWANIQRTDSYGQTLTSTEIKMLRNVISHEVIPNDAHLDEAGVMIQEIMNRVHTKYTNPITGGQSFWYVNTYRDVVYDGSYQETVYLQGWGEYEIKPEDVNPNVSDRAWAEKAVDNYFLNQSKYSKYKALWHLGDGTYNTFYSDYYYDGKSSYPYNIVWQAY